MVYAIEASEIPIVFNLKFRETGVSVLDGGSSILLFQYCPWCGTRLPESLRNRWFDELEARGIDPLYGDIPPDFRDDRWYAASKN
jgi:hypothetical protein